LCWVKVCVMRSICGSLAPLSGLPDANAVDLKDSRTNMYPL
jgi:hypothetical protein